MIAKSAFLFFKYPSTKTTTMQKKKITRIIVIGSVNVNYYIVLVYYDSTNSILYGMYILFSLGPYRKMRTKI